MAGLPPSPLIRAALATATEAHAGQIRNGAGGMPYIEHPKAVAELLAADGWTEEVLAAALLHDVVEDSEKTVEDLRTGFGDTVAELVAALSDDESIDDWRARKVEHRERVAAAGREALAIYGADKLTNVRALREAYREQGEAIAAELKVPLDLKLEAWRADLEMLSERGCEPRVVDQLARELELVSEGRGRSGRDSPSRR